MTEFHRLVRCRAVALELAPRIRGPRPVPTNFTASIFCEPVTPWVLDGVRVRRTSTWPITRTRGSCSLNSPGSVCQNSEYIAGGTLTAQGTAVTFTARVHRDIFPDENCKGSATHELGHDALSTGTYAAGVAWVLSALPTRLLNRAVETGSDRISAFVRRRHWRKDVDIPADSPVWQPRRLLPASRAVLAAGISSALCRPRISVPMWRACERRFHPGR